MPFYEYQAITPDKACSYCIEVFVVNHSITTAALIVCPKCGSPIKKLISLPGGIVVNGREANQYSDIKAAKYWRDKNGVRHKVTAADGYTTSATVNRQTATPEEIKVRKQQEAAVCREERCQLQKRRADAWNKEQLKK